MKPTQTSQGTSPQLPKTSERKNLSQKRLPQKLYNKKIDKVVRYVAAGRIRGGLSPH
ncbi:MAG TPA: hypothetical protein PK595_04955 [Bacteroidota bacterium]|nr:hypothetical protein [Bacteroidota bacterium]